MKATKRWQKQVVTIILIFFFIGLPVVVWDMKRVETDRGTLFLLIEQLRGKPDWKKNLSFRFFNQYLVLVNDNSCHIIGVYHAATLSRVEKEGPYLKKIEFRSWFGFRQSITLEAGSRIRGEGGE